MRQLRTKYYLEELFRYIVTGVPMLALILIITGIVTFLVFSLPQVGIFVAVILTMIFASATLGIAREILNELEDK